jgi:hypothetical protein
LKEIQPNGRVVISSRLDNLSRHVVSTKKLTKYIFEVQKLTDQERIEHFAAKYLRDQPLLDEFLAQIEAKETIRQMAQNPFLLVTMILVYELDRDLPNNRALLLQRLTNVLLGEQPTKTPSLYSEMCEELLAHLAFTLRERKRGLGAIEHEVTAILNDGADILRKTSPRMSNVIGVGDVPTVIDDFVQRRILTRIDPILKFWLEIIQEYFAARLIAHDLQMVYGPIGRGEAEVSLRVRSFINDADWRQILAIAIGLIDINSADAFVRGVEKRQPVLAATCLANRPSMPSRFFVTSIERRLSRLMQLSIVLTWLNTLLSVIGVYLLLKWGLPDAMGLLKSALVRLQATGLPSLVLMMAYIALVAGVGVLAPYYLFRCLDWGEEKILERVLPERYVQPLLRSLVIVNTQDASLALSKLDTEYGGRKSVPARIRAYVGQANRVWRFRRDSVDALLSMLKDPETADYAIDRLDQIGNPKAVPSLLTAAWELRPRSSKNAIWTVARIAKDGDDLTQDLVKTELKGILADQRKLTFRIRLTAYEALISLGESKNRLRVPRPWDVLTGWLLPNIGLSPAVKFSILAALILLVILSLSYLSR